MKSYSSKLDQVSTLLFQFVC
uniref:Uncharacterized protein n=1 Tax=Arundo donax TaxID=35708 RepID=A0A0A9A8M6_ARUDO